jgi:hypothetical protein
MPISVLYKNNTYGVINSKLLEKFIVFGSITKFFRSTGWATIGIDRIRKTKSWSLGRKAKITTC